MRDVHTLQTALVRHRARVSQSRCRVARELALRFGFHHGCSHPPGGNTVTAMLAVVQRIQHGQIAFAGHAKEPLHAMGDELLHQDLAAGAGGERSCSYQRYRIRKFRTRVWQARWMRAQASCKSAVEAAYEMRK